VAKDQIARFGVSLSKALLNQLDRMVQKKGYRNRSLAISDMIRDHLVGHQQEIGDGEMAGTITIVYRHASHPNSPILMLVPPKINAARWAGS
jgi:metal-responsive CopG/Arc/MetJ family transcriptional regulator